MKLVKETEEKKVVGLKKVWDSIKNNKKILMAAGTIVVVSMLLINIFIQPTQAQRLDDSVYIVQEYTQKNTAVEIRDYLELSEKLNDFMKEHRVYVKSEELSEKAQKSTLKSAEDLNKEIESLKDLLNKEETSKTAIYQRIKDLMVQEKLVNNYLYNSYFKVSLIIEDALEAYAGEKYGIIDTENIDFYFEFPNEYRVYYGSYEHGTSRGIDTNMKDAMFAQFQSTSENDPNKDDNDEYNKERNKILKQGLIESGKLYGAVKNKDLYSKRLAKTIKK